MPTDPPSESLWVSFRDLHPKGKMGQRTAAEPDQVVCTEDLCVTVRGIEEILML